MEISNGAISIDTEAIKYAILNSPHDNTPGLFNGELGKSLFCLNDFRSSADKKSLEYAVSGLNSSINLFDSSRNKELLLSLIDGLPGLRYTLNSFKTLDIFDSNDLENDIDSWLLHELANTSEVYDLIGYDLLYGLIGIGNVYLVMPPSKERDQIIESICQILEKKAIHNRGEYVWEEKFGYGLQPFNLGMAHGMLAIISFLSKVVRLSVSFYKYEQMLRGIVRWYLANENPIEFNSRFPCTVNGIGFSENRTNRLAWCYGDLSSSIALLQAGVTLNEPILVSKSLSICNSTLFRRDIKKEVDSDGESTYDCGICHGLAGITYSYLYLRNYFRTKTINEAYKFWHQQLLDRSIDTGNQTHAGCFKIERFHDQPNKPHPKLSLLEGASGVGLVHHAALNPLSSSALNPLFV